jgi:hypothetical protein
MATILVKQLMNYINSYPITLRKFISLNLYWDGIKAGTGIQIRNPKTL